MDHPTTEINRLDVPLTIIGRVRSAYQAQTGTPIQPNQGAPKPATILIYPPFRAGLADLDGFDRIWLLSWLDRSGGYNLRPIPYRDVEPRGLFATRAPRRPNPIGLSLVELLAADLATGLLTVASIDLLDQTPILDIKPYVPGFECVPDSRAGWLDRGSRRTHADDRFDDDAHDAGA